MEINTVKRIVMILKDTEKIKVIGKRRENTTNRLTNRGTAIWAIC